MVVNYKKMSNKEFIERMRNYTIDGVHPSIMDEAAERLEFFNDFNENLKFVNNRILKMQEGFTMPARSGGKTFLIRVLFEKIEENAIYKFVSLLKDKIRADLIIPSDIVVLGSTINSSYEEVINAMFEEVMKGGGNID